ncbi:MAG TPA: ABC transporter ATP-binding protein [Acidimicrobiales bacterium]|nr:ABC transporter ATP-binding protein [Acidimicrobiales bacterium]
MRLELDSITKRFGALVANDEVSLTVEPGEIHALLGENGAGKSTLMNVLFGLLHADSGEVCLDGTPVRFADPGAAVRRGIGMVHQHFMLVPVFTVAENVVLGFEPTRPAGLLDRRRARADVRRLSSEFGLEVDPDAVVESLSVGVQQRVEILKALQRDAQLLILDEPTAVLTPQETEALFKIMRSLRASGRSILFITHKLKEVLEVADRITVMRLGRVVGSTTPAETDEASLAAMMVGRDVELVVHKEPASPGDAALELAGLTVVDERGVIVVDGVDLTVRGGEIVALAGVQGNGQTELAEAISGLRAVSAGSIRFGGSEVTRSSPRSRIRAGLAHVPEDRQEDGLVLGMTIAENLILDQYDRAPFARHGVLDLARVHDNGEAKIEEFDIRPAAAGLAVGTLSGGNQQKVIVARELSRPVKVLLASQPTRGLDVGSIEYVHKRIVAARDEGAAVLIVSSELDEVLALGDRIAVMYRGRITGIVTPDVGREAIGLMMAGVEEHELPETVLAGAERDETTGWSV